MQRKILSCWLPVVILCVTIFVQSNFTAPDFGPSFPLKDKLLHMTAYGVLAAFFYRACRLTWPDRLSPVLVLAISVLFASLYGLSDELHQAFIPTRQADAYDWLADVAGSTLGAMASFQERFRQGLIGSKRRP